MAKFQHHSDLGYRWFGIRFSVNSACTGVVVSACETDSAEAECCLMEVDTCETIDVAMPSMLHKMFGSSVNITMPFLTLARAGSDNGERTHRHSI